MKTVTDVNTVNQLLTYSKQAEAGIHQKAIQMLLGAGNNKKQDSLSISDAARGFSKQSIAALIDKNANISNSELAYYFANYNNSSAILDAINFGENVSCGYNSDFKEYGVISFDLNGSRQVVPNYAVPKMNTSTMSGICAANNSLVLSNKSYYSWTTSSGGKYTWTVNNGRIGWAASESLLAENTNQKGQIISGKCAKQVIFYLIWHRERVCGVISTVTRKYCQSVRKSGFLRDSFL